MSNETEGRDEEEVGAASQLPNALAMMRRRGRRRRRRRRRRRTISLLFNFSNAMNEKLCPLYHTETSP